MSVIVQPLATIDLAGTPVRFFRAPGTVPHLLWHAVPDLHRALRFPHDLAERMLRHARGFPGGDFATVPTAAGLVTIGSHPMAQGLIGAALEIDAAVSGVPADFEHLYAQAAAKAFDAVTGDLPPMAAMQLMMVAARNTLEGGE